MSNIIETRGPNPDLPCFAEYKRKSSFLQWYILSGFPSKNTESIFIWKVSNLHLNKKFIKSDTLMSVLLW